MWDGPVKSPGCPEPVNIVGAFKSSAL